jgi:hypothetical protein
MGAAAVRGQCLPAARDVLQHGEVMDLGELNDVAASDAVDMGLLLEHRMR